MGGAAVAIIQNQDCKFPIFGENNNIAVKGYPCVIMTGDVFPQRIKENSCNIGGFTGISFHFGFCQHNMTSLMVRSSAEIRVLDHLTS